MSFSSPRRASRRSLSAARRVRRLVDSLELRTLLTGSPTATWDLATPSTFPVVRVDLDGGTWNTAGANGFRGINLTASAPGNVLTRDAGTDAAGRRGFGAGTTATPAMPADGNYEFHVLPNAVTPALGAEAVFNDFFVNADFDHDRDVDFADLLAQSKNYNGTGKSFAQGDTDGNGTVDFADLLWLTKRYNKRLAAAPTYAGQVTAGSEPLVEDSSQADGTRTALTVTWAAIADVADDPNTAENESVTIAGYSVFRSDDGIDFSKVGEVARAGGNPDTYQYTDDTAVDGQKYWYRIRPFYNVTLPDGTAGIQHLPTTNKVWKVAALGGPSNAIAKRLTATSLTLHWQDDGRSYETGYRIYKIGRDGITRTLVATVGRDATQAVVTGLDEGTSYTFAAVAYTDGIESLPAIVQASPGVGAQVSNVADGVRISWAVGDPVPLIGYLVSVKAAGETEYTELPLIRAYDGVQAGGTTFLDTTAIRGKQYTYKVEELGGYDSSTGQQSRTLVGQVEVDYRPRPTLSYTSDQLTITWPSGSTPPAVLEVTLTNQTTRERTVTNVSLSTPDARGSGGSGQYVLPDLPPDTSFTVEYRDRSQDSENGENPTASDQPVAFHTRTFIDGLAAAAIPGGGSIANTLWPGVTFTHDRRFTGAEAKYVKPLKNGDSITFTVGNLPEHSYLHVNGGFTVAGYDRIDENASSTVPKPTLTATIDGGALHTTDAPYNSYENAYTADYYSGSDKDSGWVQHSGSTATITVTVSGIPGYQAQIAAFGVDVGTPTFSIDQQVNLTEVADDAEGKTFKLKRANDVARDEKVEVQLKVEEKEGQAAAADVTIDATVTIPAGADEVVVRVKSKDDTLAEDAEEIWVVVTADGSEPQTLKVGSIDDDIIIRDFSVKRIPLDLDNRARFSTLADVTDKSKVNGYTFAVEMHAVGEHLDKIYKNQKLFIETRMWSSPTPTSPTGELTKAEVAAEVDQGSSGPPEYTNSVDWTEDRGWHGWTTLTIDFQSKNGAATWADQQSWYTNSAIINSPGVGEHTVSLITSQNNDFKVMFSKKSTGEAAQAFDWGFTWTNDNLRFDGNSVPVNATNVVVASSAVAPHKGRFSGRGILTGIETLN